MPSFFQLNPRGRGVSAYVIEDKLFRREMEPRSWPAIVSLIKKRYPYY